MAVLVRLSVMVLAVWAAPASGELPQAVRAMIDAAIATGDAAKVGTVTDLARQTNPGDVDEIDALQAAFQARQRAAAAAEDARRQSELRTAALLENWSGRGQIGAFQSSGNSSNIGITLALALERTGIDWQHRLRINTDYQRSNGRTSREQYFLAYEPRYQIDTSLFAYGLAQYERDRFQGLASRYSASGGIGYRIVGSDTAQLAAKLGPAWRRVNFVDGRTESNFGALAGLDFDWRLARQLKFTHDANFVADTHGSANVFLDSHNTSVLLDSALEAVISTGLTTRLSYTVDYNSHPPSEAVSTDTLTRFTLVYDF